MSGWLGWIALIALLAWSAFVITFFYRMDKRLTKALRKAEERWYGH